VSATTPGNGERQPDAEREARRAARSERRDAPAERPGVMIPSGRKRLPLEAPLMRAVATGGIVGIGVVIAAIMTSQDSQGWADRLGGVDRVGGAGRRPVVLATTLSAARVDPV
jgi:hypothetical protein